MMNQSQALTSGLLSGNYCTALKRVLVRPVDDISAQGSVTGAAASHDQQDRIQATTYQRRIVQSQIHSNSGRAPHVSSRNERTTRPSNSPHPYPEYLRIRIYRDDNDTPLSAEAESKGRNNEYVIETAPS